MSDITFFADLLSKLEQPHGGVRTVSVQGSTGSSRSETRALLAQMLAGCGCGAPVCTETETRLTLCFDLPGECATSLYMHLVEAGLEFNGDSHRELTRLCTVQSHAVDLWILERPCTMRLELRFPGEGRRGTKLPPGALA